MRASDVVHIVKYVLQKIKNHKKSSELDIFPILLFQHVRRPSSGSDWEPLKETHEYKGGNTLRDYQLEGVNWLTFSWYKR